MIKYILINSHFSWFYFVNFCFFFFVFLTTITARNTSAGASTFAMTSTYRFFNWSIWSRFTIGTRTWTWRRTTSTRTTSWSTTITWPKNKRKQNNLISNIFSKFFPIISGFVWMAVNIYSIFTKQFLNSVIYSPVWSNLITTWLSTHCLVDRCRVSQQIIQRFIQYNIKICRRNRYLYFRKILHCAILTHFTLLFCYQSFHLKNVNILMFLFFVWNICLLLFT